MAVFARGQGRGRRALSGDVREVDLVYPAALCSEQKPWSFVRRNNVFYQCNGGGRLGATFLTAILGFSLPGQSREDSRLNASEGPLFAKCTAPVWSISAQGEVAGEDSNRAPSKKGLFCRERWL